MNEVFTIPKDPLDAKEKGDEKIESSNSKKSFDERFITRYFLYFPFITYSLIFGNDVSTAFIGYEIAPIHTILQIIVSYIFLCSISDICRKCNNEKVVAQEYYNHTISNQFKFQIDTFSANINEQPNFNKRYKRFFLFLKQPFITLKFLIPYFRNK